MNILERIQAADEAIRADYSTPLGSVRMVSIRFGLPVAAVEPLHIAEMWRRLAADREAKRRAKLGLDKDSEPHVTPLRPSKRLVGLGIKWMRCPGDELPKGAVQMRAAAWAASWEITCTRWVGMVPSRKTKVDPWEWRREARVTLWLRRVDEWGIAEWRDGSWSSGWYWHDGEMRRPLGNRALLAVIKAEQGSGSL